MTVDALGNGLGALVLLLIANQYWRYIRESAEAENGCRWASTN